MSEETDQICPVRVADAAAPGLCSGPGWFAALFGAHPAVMLLVDQGSGRILEINRAGERFYRYPREDLLRRSLWDFTVGVAGDAQAPAWEPAERGVQRHRLGNGEIRYVELTLGPAPAATSADDGGMPYAPLLVVVTDVHDRVALENRLRESEQRFLDVVDAAEEFVCELDTRGRFLWLSPRVGQITGYAPQELTGRRLFDFVAADLAGSAAELFFTAVDRRARLQGPPWPVIRQDGIRVWIRLSGVPMVDSSGHLVGYRCLGEDVTAGQRADEETRRAMEAAEAASAAKSDFLAVMSHEIRTPMHGILGMARLLLDSPLPGNASERVRTILSSGEALLSLLNDILDISKLEAGRMELESEDFDLPLMLSSLADMIRSLAAEKGLVFVEETVSRLPVWLHGDGNRLRQILVNLLGNAIKFTAAGSVTLRASVEHETETTVVLRFDIQDTGPGMSLETRQKLFQPFVQGGGVARQHGGTGLGLAISRRLVAQMGGAIGVESTPGEGSRFWIRLPMTRGVPVVRIRWDIPVADADAPLRVLVAEDNSVNRLVAVGLLERAGYVVKAVGNGREAVQAVGSEAFDVVLMDVQMPEMDGIEATQAIRRLFGPRGRIPIIALTASAIKSEQERCLAAGMDDFLTKPILPERLFATLCRHARPGETIELGLEEPGGAEGAGGPVVLDREMLTHLVAQVGDVTVTEIYSLFASQVQERLGRLHAAVTQGDTGPEARLIAHSIKGMASSLGFPALEEASAALEAANLHPPYGDQSDLLLRLDRTVAESLYRLRQAMPQVFALSS